MSEKPWPEFESFEDFKAWMLSGGKPSDEDVERAEHIARDKGWLTDEGWIWDRA